MKSALVFNDGTKESLLNELSADIQQKTLPIRENTMVNRIIKMGDHFVVETSTESLKALRVVVAIGKSGNTRSLGVAGKDLPKVFTRLLDPTAHLDQDILVVGGGDSAAEAAIALALEGNRVTLSYRGKSLSRPKEHNVLEIEKLEKAGKLTVLLETTVKKIQENTVTINSQTGETQISNQVVYALIGTEIPIAFFNRSGIRIEGEQTFPDYVKFATLLLFASVLYFGKSAPVTPIASWEQFFSIPFDLLSQSWPKLIKGISA